MSRKPDILKAAAELFAAKGYHVTSTHEIAERAELSEGIIFYYFKTKDHILMGILEDIFEAYLVAIYEAMERVDTGWEAIKAFVEVHFKLRMERSTEIACLVRDFPIGITNPGSQHREDIRAYHFRLVKLVKEALERGAKDGSLRPCPLGETACMLIGLLSSIPRFDIFNLTPEGDLLTETLDFVHRALAPTP
ncbi:MAG: TetR/AcrR family transcriptional regulator [Desulfarculaceae bacterium]|nr:TetR/AcrR family transcriptional regulator [Desulfarculaceae bacterium]